MSKCIAFPVIDLAATGRSIEQCRKAAGLSVRDVQTYFGFEYPQAVYKWQHGDCLPSVDNLLALSHLLRVPMEDLLVYEDREVSYFLGSKELLFYVIGNCAKIRATSTMKLKNVKLFGSGSAHGALFCF